MKKIIDRLAQSETPSLNEFIEPLSRSIEELVRLEQTPQDHEWHGEGNVYSHTERVLQQVYTMLDSEASHLTWDQKLALIFAAILHDVGKIFTTKNKEIDGTLRIVSPHHDIRGCSYLAYRLLDLDIPYSVVQHVLRLVFYHHHPRQLILRNASSRDYIRLARQVNVELLYYLEKADVEGRICPNQQIERQHIELFRLFCEEYRIFGVEDPYEDWRLFFRKELKDLSPESIDAVLGYGIQDFEQGLIHTPEEAMARRYPYFTSFPELVVMCGPSGSGKSTWIRNHLNEYSVVSLDDLRACYGNGRHDQTRNSIVLSKAKELLKTHLRKHSKIVWDATNLRKDFRKIVCDLGFCYHGLVTLVVFHSPTSEIYRGNESRTHHVPQDVLRTQMDLLEWVEDCEAHRIAFVIRGKTFISRGFSLDFGQMP